MKFQLKQIGLAVARALLAPVAEMHERLFVLNAVVNTKSTAVTNADAAPQVHTPAYIIAGKLREMVGTVEVANGDSIASTLRFFRVHSSWRPSELKLYCDAITSAAADFGLYDTAENGGAVVDVDFFASAQSIASAILTGTDITYEANTGPADVSKIEQRIWQLLGLTADPGKFYDVVATLTAAATAAGTCSLKGRFVEN